MPEAAPETLRPLVEHVARSHDWGVFTYSPRIRHVMWPMEATRARIIFPAMAQMDSDDTGVLLVSPMRGHALEGGRAFTCVEADGSERSWLQPGPGAPLLDWDAELAEAAHASGVQRHHPADLAALRRFRTGRATFVEADVAHGHWDPAYWVCARALASMAKELAAQRAQWSRRQGEQELGNPDAGLSKEDIDELVAATVSEAGRRLAIAVLREQALLSAAALGPRILPEDTELPEDAQELWQLARQVQAAIAEVGWHAFSPERLGELLDLPEQIDCDWWGSEGIAGIALCAVESPLISLLSLHLTMEPAAVLACRMLPILHDDARFASEEDLLGPDGFIPPLPPDWEQRHPWVEMSVHDDVTDRAGEDAGVQRER